MEYKVLSASPTFGHFVSDPVEYLKENGCQVTLVPKGQKISEDELIESVAELDAIIVGFEQINEQVLQATNRLKVVAKHGAGVDNIDMKAATERGVVVISAPGLNSDAVAELTMGLFLSMARRIPFANQSVKEGGWPRYVGVELNKKTVGVIGVGQIGKKVAKCALGFNMNVLAYDVFEDKDFAQKWGIKYLPLDEVISKSDFISVYVPLMFAICQLINPKELGLMKRDAYLVNISRGGVVDEDALYAVLKDKKIGGAALDVFSQEPPGESPLLELDNLIATPHMGMYTVEALRETGMVCARGIVDTLQGRQPQNINNPEVFD